MDSSEQEFWNLDDSNEESSAPTTDAAEEPATPDDSNRPPEPNEAPGGLPLDLADSATDDLDDLDDLGPDEEEPPNRSAGTTSLSGDDTEERPGAARGEKLALGILGAILLVGLIWGAVTFVGTMPDGGSDESVEFPVAGTSVTITAADTYWRKPDRDKDTGIRLDTRLIPAAEIKLEVQPGTCALRFFFKDDKSDFVGDATTLPVNNGKFKANGSSQIEVYGTAGFLDPGDHAAYATEQIDTWYLVIMEGPDRNAPGAEFKEIARVPISFNRK